LYPGYSASKNYISDLGIGPSAIIFNFSVFLLGVLVVASSYFIQRAYNSKTYFFLGTLTGIGAMGVGLFPETFLIPHAIASLITFLFGGISAIVSCKIQKTPLSYFYILLGIMALIASTLTVTGNHLGLGIGGMERMIAYPILLWGVSFSSFLISHE
jgi:hypothetical membrane protein